MRASWASGQVGHGLHDCGRSQCRRDSRDRDPWRWAWALCHSIMARWSTVWERLSLSRYLRGSTPTLDWLTPTLVFAALLLGTFRRDHVLTLYADADTAAAQNSLKFAFWSKNHVEARKICAQSHLLKAVEDFCSVDTFSHGANIWAPHFMHAMRTRLVNAHA
jgi:hypothetical protein